MMLPFDLKAVVFTVSLWCRMKVAVVVAKLCRKLLPGERTVGGFMPSPEDCVN